MDVNNTINYLNNSNNLTVKTLLNGFVNEVTIKYLPFYVFETLAINKEAQEIIMSLPEQHLKNISKIIKYAESVNQDWIPLCARYYHFLNNKNFSDLVNAISNTELSQLQIEKLLFAINNEDNYFNINSIQDINNLSNVRNAKVNPYNTLNNPNILLLNKYGISYNQARNIYMRYGQDTENLPESPEKDFLIDIKNIIEGKGTDVKVFGDIKFIINIDSILRNFFSKIYDGCFYRATDDKKINIIDGVKIYDAGVDFNMCIYSYGMATEYKTPKNFKDDWNRPNISTDYMCNSIINSWSLKTHVKHCLFGFDNWGENNITLLGSNDLGTGGIYQNLNVTNPFYRNQLIADADFRTPNSLINNTRFTNNEVYRSRRKVANGRLERINPNYIVYLKKNEKYNNDPIWLESLKAAKEFNIPIVVIDCKRCLLNNIEKIESNLKIFEMEYDNPKLLKTILELIYTLSYGYKDVYKDIEPNVYEEHFNKNKLISYFLRIINHIDEIAINNLPNAIKCINILLDTLNREYEKILKSPYWVDYARKEGYIIEKPQEIINIVEKKKHDLEILNDQQLIK